MASLFTLTVLVHQVVLCLSGPAVRSTAPSRIVPTMMGKFEYPNAAFSAIVQQPNTKQSPKFDLILSSFSMFSSDVSIVRDVRIDGHMGNIVASDVPKTLTKDLKWPNEVAPVPSNVFNDTSSRYIAIPDGFLVPFHGDGSLSLIDIDVENPVKMPLTASKGSWFSAGGGTWFYHRVRWVDMDKDGRLDALTARANIPMFGGSKKGQLVWLKNPQDGSLDQPWEENVLATGPDVFFEFDTITVGDRTYEVIITAEYFTPRIRIFWTEDPEQKWMNTNAVKYRDIDDVNGLDNPFAILFKDLNGDGLRDILVSFNSPTNGTVFAYELHGDFRTGTVKRHLLADGYKPKTTGKGKGAPGGIYLVDGPTTKPTIFVSGDDAAVASQLVPKDAFDTKNWSYDRVDFIKTDKSTIGGLTIADVNGDNVPELFLPSYNEGLVYMFSLNEKK